MNKRVSFNLQILPAEKTFISAVSSAALYGKGVFTTIAIYNRKPFLWEKHWRRLEKNSARLEINLSDLTEETVKRALFEVISENDLEKGRARLTFFDESASKIWNSGAGSKTNFLITTAGFQKTKDNLLLTLSSFPVNSKSPLAGVKSCNYAENLLALEEGKKRGFDEVVRLNEKGEIVSAATANIFWVKNEKIFTPPLETGCLAGTTREFLMENFPVTETISTSEALSNADEIFLTSSGIGASAARFANVKETSSPMTTKINQLLDSHRQ